MPAAGPFFRRSLKLFARQAINMNVKLCFRASTAVVAVALVLLFIQRTFGHLLIYYIMSAAENTGVASGLQITGQGLAAALRIDPAGIILAFQMTWGEIGTFVLESLLVLLIGTPVMYGALGHFHSLLRRQAPDLKSLFRWYTDLRLALPCMGMELLLAVVTWVLRVAGMIPGLALFSAALAAPAGSFAARLGTLSTPVLLAGMLLAYFVSCQLEPARYYLACDPSLGLRGALRTGWASLKGRRADFFWFSFSFIGWELFSAFTYGLGDIYLLPYRGLSTILYLGIVDPNQFQSQEVTPHV